MSLSTDAEKHAFGAQLALLHRCTTSIARLLRRRASLLPVAKIIVVSRLLHKTLSQNETHPPFLDDLRNQLASLRLNLLKRIDRRLASISATEESVIESLAAYCLATSSSSDDAIHHFHGVRQDVIRNQLELSRDNVPKALKLFIQTLQTSKALRSRQFSDVLSKLKARPLLDDPDIRSLEGLDIDVLGRWVASDVNNFTPWIKLSELSRSEGVETIKEWSVDAFERFAEGCERSLEDSNDFSKLLSLRTNTFELWLSFWGSALVHPSVDVLERLRTIFNRQLTRVLTAQALNLGECGTQVLSIVSDWENTEHTSIGSLWDADLITTEYSNGATSFKLAVTDRLLGRDDDVSLVLQMYHDHLSFIRDVNESVDSLRRMRWPDIFLGGEVEDDIEITPKLNEDDPRLLTEALHTAIRQAFSNLQTSFNDAFKSFGSSHQREKATFLLRLIRLIRRDIPSDYVANDFVFSSQVIPELQTLLANEVVTHAGSLKLIPLSRTHPDTGQLKIVPGRSLWDGEPASPVQPSPSTFKFLRRLMASMELCGADLWDPSTVRILKDVLNKQLKELVSSALEELDNSPAPKKVHDAKTELNGEQTVEDGVEEAKAETDGEAHTDASSQSEVLRDWKLQLFFDSVYLSNMLGGPNQLPDAVDRVQKSADPSMETVKMIRKIAQDYWKRTEMLFGLLASDKTSLLHHVSKSTS